MTDYAKDVARLRDLLTRWDTVPPGDEAFAVCKETFAMGSRKNSSAPCSRI